jgi:hypothetical protein
VVFIFVQLKFITIISMISTSTRSLRSSLSRVVHPYSVRALSSYCDKIDVRVSFLSPIPDLTLLRY